ncbi:MAG: peptidogalycan biosysnthesis protein, partial [Pseudomonadota bacterium]
MLAMNYTIKIIDNFAQINEAQWNSLARDAGPFLQHAFLRALEQSQCCTNETGWQPCHIVLLDNERIVTAIPGYLKTHSYGEYVFDHAWANAYHQHGLDYYPKWISAIPFTPVT